MADECDKCTKKEEEVITFSHPNITWKLGSSVADPFHSKIEECLELWAAKENLSFEEVEEEKNADIQICFSDKVSENGFEVQDKNIHFDNVENFHIGDNVIDIKKDTRSFRAVALLAIGFALGKNSCENDQCIMYHGK